MSRFIVDDVIDFYNTIKKDKFKKLSFQIQNGNNGSQKTGNTAEDKNQNKIESAQNQSGIQIVKSDRIKEIENMAKNAKKLAEFHNGLVKKYGIEEGLKVYKGLKEKVKGVFENRGKNK